MSALAGPLSLPARLRRAVQALYPTRSHPCAILMTHAADDLESLTRRHAAAIEVLRLVEWADYDCGDYFCPVCHGGKNEGHHDDCKLALLLSQRAAVASGEGEAE